MTTRAFWSLLVAIGLFCLPGTAAAQDTASQPWLHVQISGGGHDDGDGHDDSDSRDDDGEEGHGDGDRHDDDGGDDGHCEDDRDEGEGNGNGDDGHGEDDGDEGHGDSDDGHDDGDEEEDFNLNINLPLSAVEPLLSLVPHRILADGRLAVAGHGMPVDIGAVRNLWRAIADIGDAEFLSVDSGDETVRIARTGDQIRVQVEECDDGGEIVEIRLPVAVLDALLSGDGETLDVAAAVERLAGVRGDIVRISDDDRQIRIWIDELAHSGE